MQCALDADGLQTPRQVSTTTNEYEGGVDALSELLRGAEGHRPKGPKGGKQVGEKDSGFGKGKTILGPPLFSP